ncbi:FAD-dependent oxidoreductase [Pseudotamlana carrageenivorans]|uniref:FAD-dependent oxidoreductase n=1 Tax=Pseudotamlana carrageenivorans TaxID=2069432 RepID=A0A2I7SM92_9FLAO|nr:FAD-dependent oxidoreductase [Tamlana carrageenivorans]AUS07025.1 FAD-dependent oxidoreductase [Tamlana carrageenivorans]
MSKIYNVGIIGAGVSGVVTALQLAKHNIDSVLFEQEKSVVNGPPFCHLHAGGNLYPDISIEQCKLLMKQSIEMARLFPESIDERPTFISVPKTEKYEIAQLTKRLDALVAYYTSLIAEDPANAILGKPEAYYKVYSQSDLMALAKHPVVAVPKSADQWLINTLHLVDFNKLKTPVILVQEFGWNLFRLGAQAQLALEKSQYCDLKMQTNVRSIKDVRHKNLDHNWEIQTKDTVVKTRYLVNSSGFKAGDFDASLRIKTKHLIEFKAAYVSKWQPISGLIPELIFHGERGTPRGMVQLTPYRDHYYQIHAMTNAITLFEKGLVKSDAEIKLEFDRAITQKLKHGWETNEVNERTEKAIASVAQFLPAFKSATVGGPPLFGAQQIPGDDPSFRVGEVSFPCKTYARSEIVKASSALTVARQIMDQIKALGIISNLEKRGDENALLESISKDDIDALARRFAMQRGYPEALSQLLIPRKS